MFNQKALTQILDKDLRFHVLVTGTFLEEL